MKPETKVATLARLARIEGQIRAIQKMVDADRYCIDVLRQVKAARAALASMETVILRDHIDTCVDHALTGDDIDARREKVEELVAVLGGTKK